MIGAIGIRNQVNARNGSAQGIFGNIAILRRDADIAVIGPQNFVEFNALRRIQGHIATLKQNVSVQANIAAERGGVDIAIGCADGLVDIDGLAAEGDVPGFEINFSVKRDAAVAVIGTKETTKNIVIRL